MLLRIERRDVCVTTSIQNHRSGPLKRRKNLHEAATAGHGGGRITGDLILLCLLSPDFLLCVGMALTLTSRALAPAFWAVAFPALCPTPKLGCGHTLPAPLLRASPPDTSPCHSVTQASSGVRPLPCHSGRQLHGRGAPPPRQQPQLFLTPKPPHQNTAREGGGEASVKEQGHRSVPSAREHRCRERPT